MKRITVIILAMLMLIGTITVYAASPFSDVKESNWAYASVKAMVDKAIINGYPDGTFKPNKKVTYGEFIKLLIVSKDYNLPIAEKGEHWANNHFQKAYELNLFPYGKITTSMLDQEIPREMMAYLLSMSLGDIDIEKYDSLRAEIIDIKGGDEYLYPIVKIYSTGILNGYPDGTFKQKESLTRAEMAVALEKYIKFSNGEVIEKYTANQEAAQTRVNDSIVESYLQKSVDDGSGVENEYQYYGVDSAQELKEKLPIVYSSILRLGSNDPLFSNLIVNPEELRSPFNDVDTKTYAIVKMQDIGITKIEKVRDKYNSEYLVVTPKYKNTERMEAVLIKGAKIVCNLTGSKSSTATVISYWPPTQEYYNGSYKNNTLIDFDYIAFYEFTGVPTVFLVKNPL